MDELDDMLNTAGPASAPQGLMDRVLADALAHQPQRAAKRAGLWRALREALGGWQGLGGLIAATCAGLWIGLSPPDYLPLDALDLMGSAARASGTDVSGFGWTFALEEDLL